jgi:hypothetical protein
MISGPIKAVREMLLEAIKLAEPVFERTDIDRTSTTAALDTALLAMLGWCISQAYCMHSALATRTPHAVGPNVRAMLEALISAMYLTDPKADPAETKNRLDRYYRGARRAQVKLRSALDAYPGLKMKLIINQALADAERDELKHVEDALPHEHRLGKKHWSGRADGLKSMAEAVGLDSDYALQYRIHSGSAHGNRPWDQVLVDRKGLLVKPVLDDTNNAGFSYGSDAFRYLAWSLDVAYSSGTVCLDDSEIAKLESFRTFLEPIDVLIEKGVIGP